VLIQVSPTWSVSTSPVSPTTGHHTDPAPNTRAFTVFPAYVLPVCREVVSAAASGPSLAVVMLACVVVVHTEVSPSWFLTI